MEKQSNNNTTNNHSTATANTLPVEPTTIPEIASDNTPEAPASSVSEDQTLKMLNELFNQHDTLYTEELAENDSEENINEEPSTNNDDNTQQIEFLHSPFSSPEETKNNSELIPQRDDNVEDESSFADNHDDDYELYFKNSPLNRYNMFKNNGMTIGAIVVPAISLGLFVSPIMAMAPSVAALVGTLAAVAILSALVGAVIGGLTGASIELFTSHGLYPFDESCHNNNIR